MVKNKWIQKLKEGALHRQLGIPEDQKIPVNLLHKIVNTNIGDYVEYTVNGKKVRKRVTRLLKQRANAAIVLRKIRSQQ